MKKIASLLSLLLIASAFTSCVETSKKYKALEAERDSLMTVAANVTTDFESSLQTINEIEMALQTIREAESIIMMESQEGNSNYAMSQIEAIDRSIQQNKAKIASLEQQLAEAGSKSKQLNATINRLKNELNEKDTYINQLREELNVSKAQVAQLSGRVQDLQSDVQNLNENIQNLSAQSAEQQATIRVQDVELNTVYYIVAPIETLKANDIVTKGGLFKKETISSNINRNVFIAADKRDLTTIPLNTRKASILTNHPESSYRLVHNDEQMLSLEIIDKDAFWNISNYLIISIK